MIAIVAAWLEDSGERMTGLDRLITGHKINSLGRASYHVMAKCDKGRYSRTIDDGSGNVTPLASWTHDWPTGASDTVGVA